MTDIASVAGEGDPRASPYRYWEVKVPATRLSVVHLRCVICCFFSAKIHRRETTGFPTTAFQRRFPISLLDIFQLVVDR